MIPALLLLAYNRATTGSPFTLGYIAAHGSLHALGFGLRGFRHGMQFLFTPVVAVTAVLQRVAALGREALAPYLLVPVVTLACGLGARPRWRGVTLFLVLPVLYAFFFHSANRFYIDLLPFGALGIAALVWEVPRRPLRLSRLVALLALLNVVFAPRWGVGDLARASEVEARVTTELSHASIANPLLVLLSRGDRALPLVLAGSDSTSRVLVYFSRGVDDSILVRRFPNRTVIRVTWDAAKTHASLELGSPK